MVVLSTPFRLFFLLAAVMAGLVVPWWLLVLQRGVPLESDLGPFGWHAHEMIFGYTAAVLAGFLLTAARSWTKRPTASGAALAALVTLWIGARGAALRSRDLPGWMSPLLCGLFFAGITLALALPIVAARSRRNLAFPLLLAVIGACDLAIHLGARGLINGTLAARAPLVAIDAVVLIIFIFGGRIIPMFTAKALSLHARAKGALDWLGLGGLVAVLALHAAGIDNALLHGLLITTGGLNGTRLWRWGGSRSVREPLLWVLHGGWLLACAGLALSGIAGFGVIGPTTAALHLLTVGGIGMLTLGMMARVSLGHTGRALVAPGMATVSFVLLLVAVMARVIPEIVSPAHYVDALWLATFCWAASFGLFVLGYGRMLLAPRADGKSG